MRRVGIIICTIIHWLVGASQPQLAFTEVASGLTSPVDITHAGDERLFIVEQPGTIRIIGADGEVLSQPYLDIRSRVNDNRSERGLLGLAFHPDYEQNGYFYVNYTRSDGQTVIARFTRQGGTPNQADPNSEQILMAIPQPFSNHNGGDLAFGPDGYLYIPLGDGGSGGDPEDNGQDLSTLLGSILRIDVNGGTPFAIPADNPFVGQADSESAIWSWGWRNPWRLSFDRLTGDMWIADVGQDGREEIDMEPAGAAGGLNYGWRCVEGTAPFIGSGCTGSGYAPPVFEYAHPGQDGRSVTGGFVYRGSAYPNLEGWYFFGDYISGDFWATRANGMGGWQTEALGTFSAIGRTDLSTFGEDHVGELYVANYKSGVIYQLQDATASTVGQPIPTLQVGPLPWRDVLYIECPKSAKGPLSLALYDLHGRVVAMKDMASQPTLTFSRGIWPDGLYVLELRSGTGRWRQKVWCGQ